MTEFLKKNYKWLLFGALVIVIKLFSMNRQWVERYYSNGVYPVFAKILRFCFGWIPFSLGDILYGLAVAWVLWKIIKHGRALFQKRVTWKSFGKGLFKTCILLLGIYIVFNAFWGINYNRLGIASQLNLKMDTFSIAELENINQLLVDKVNACKKSLLANKTAYPGNGEMFRKTAAAYENLQNQYPFLAYKPVALKSSMWGWLGNYTGFLGYYNPFTGEAQVNTTIPRFLLPFTCCHEVAHQLGYAREMEANFVGYLAAASSTDTVFKYSVYLDLFTYANRTLVITSILQHDSTLRKKYYDQLIPEVKADQQEWRDFASRHRNPVEPIIRKGYSFYLRRNEQPMGMRSYDEVTSFLIAFFKKFGKI